MNTQRQKLTLREIQLEELEILLKVRDFFEAHNIRYILCGGTLLGAVRLEDLSLGMMILTCLCRVRISSFSGK